MSNPAREKQSSLQFIPLESLDAALFAVGTVTATGKSATAVPSTTVEYQARAPTYSMSKSNTKHRCTRQGNGYLRRGKVT